MNSSPEEHITAAEYALGLLSEQEALQFEQNMAQDPTLKAAYVYWAERLVTLADEWPEQAPPEHIKEQLNVYLEQQQAEVIKINTPSRMERYQTPFWAMAAAIVLALGIWLVLPSQFEANYQTYLASTSTELTVDVLVDADDKQLKVVPIKGQPATQGDYELWVAIGDGAPMSLGVLDITQTTYIELDVDWIEGLSNAHMAISLEPKGGSPTGQPTGPVLAVADTMTL